MNRRNFLRITGSTAVILAASAGGYLTTRSPDQALSPWQHAGGSEYSDPRLYALSYAILAPNPHNRQPWMVDLSVPDEITLHCDLERLLPHTDPFNRQITIGLGCFLENLRIAATNKGYRADITPFPEGTPTTNLDNRPIAHITFKKQTGLKADGLFAQILDRRSAKAPFDTSMPVADATLASLKAEGQKALASGHHVSATNDMARVEGFRDIAWNAHKLEVTTPRTNQESIDLMRIGKAEINANPDGIDLGGPFLETLAALGGLSRKDLADPTSSAFAQGIDMYNNMHNSTMAFVWVTTKGNDRKSQLDAGAAWVRINLQATGMGVALHPVSQALQEYEEMTDLYNRIVKDTNTKDGERLQMFGRLGYAAAQAPSPRWPLDTKITKQS
jgi:hypothetical protein